MYIMLPLVEGEIIYSMASCSDNMAQERFNNYRDGYSAADTNLVLDAQNSDGGWDKGLSGVLQELFTINVRADIF